MATKYAVATGNWSATTTWNGGTLPTSADDVYANTFTVTIDQNVTVLSLRTTSTTGVTAGGNFTVSGAYTINCSSGSGIVPGSSAVITCTNTSGTTVNILGAINQGTASASCITITGTGTVNTTGNITTTTTWNIPSAVLISAAGILNHTGNITVATSGKSNGIGISAAATVTVTGNVTGGGNGDSAGTGSGVYVAASGAVVSIIGNVRGSTVSPTAVFAGVGVYGVGGTTITIIGSLTSDVTMALYNAGTSILSGPFYSNASGMLPFYCAGIVKLTGIANNEFRFLKSTTGTTSLFSGDVTSLSPLPSDVRAGTTFGVGNAYTGTMSVPSASSVAAGAYVDNTVGTAALSLSTIAALTGAQISAALST